MAHPGHTRQNVWILVKAFPQPSQRYEETVCCAGITEDGSQLLRLYPIRYRRLLPDQKFNRYDLVSLETYRPTSDHRPESVRVIESSMVIDHRRTLPRREWFKLWRPFIADSLEALYADNLNSNRSLGIIRPDPASVRFSWKSVADSSDVERENLRFTRQAMLFEDSLTPLQKDFTFFYTFTTGHQPHRCQILDWEVQATYYRYSQRYGDEALPRMQAMWQETFVKQNLHLVMGTLLEHPRTFSIVGVLRTAEDLDALAAQGGLFES